MAFGARVFTNSGDNIETGSSATLTPTALSISLWFNPSVAISAGVYRNLFGRNKTNNSSYFIGGSGTANKLAIYVNHDASTRISVDPITTALSVGTWYHVGASYDSSAGLATFINGASGGTASANGTLYADGGVTMMGDDSNPPQPGSLSDAAIWNTVLTAGEFAALASGMRPLMVRPAALIGYWPLNGINSPEQDLSGNAFNGTVTGTTNAAGPPLTLSTPRWPMFIPPSVAAQQILMGQIWM